METKKKIERFSAYGPLSGPRRAEPAGRQVVDARADCAACQRRDAVQRDSPFVGRHFAPYADRHVADARVPTAWSPARCTPSKSRVWSTGLTVWGEPAAPCFRTRGMGAGEYGGILPDRRKKLIIFCVVRMRDTLSVRELCAVRPGKRFGVRPGCRIIGEER